MSCSYGFKVADTQSNRIEAQRCEKSSIYSVKYWADMSHRQEEPEFWIVITDLYLDWCVSSFYEKDVQDIWDATSLPHVYPKKN